MPGTAESPQKHCHIICCLASRKQRQRRHAKRVHASKRRQQPCLFCRSTTNPFTSVEHIVGESLVGQHRAKLLHRVVCDHCNNGPLAVLDNEIADFLPIKFMRTVYGITGKRGHIAETRASNVVIEHQRDELAKNPQPQIKVMLQHERVWEDTPEGFKLNLEGGRRLTAKYIATLVRALYKITLELIHLDHGPQQSMHPRFDDVREIVLGNKPFSGSLMLLKSGEPNPQASFTYEFVTVDGDLTVTIIANIYGVRMFTDLLVRELRRKHEVPEKLRKLVEIHEFTNVG